MKKIYICQDSLEGIFTGIYYAWPTRHLEERDKLTIQSDDSMELFSEYVEVAPEKEKAVIVLKTVERHLGSEGYENICAASLSCESKKADAILGTLIAAVKIKNSKRVMDYLINEDVRTVFELNRNVYNESHHYKMFIRFKELQNHILLSEIAPKNNVLPMLSSHFSDRFPLENWVIHDRRRKTSILHEKENRCIMLTGEELDLEKIKMFSEEESEMQDLWKQFKDSISIKERENIKLQKKNLPLRFRKYMVEFE